MRRIKHKLAAISIHAPRKGERRKKPAVGYGFIAISIHAPRKGERL